MQGNLNRAGRPWASDAEAVEEEAPRLRKGLEGQPVSDTCRAPREGPGGSECSGGTLVLNSAPLFWLCLENILSLCCSILESYILIEENTVFTLDSITLPTHHLSWEAGGRLGEVIPRVCASLADTDL